MGDTEDLKVIVAVISYADKRKIKLLDLGKAESNII